MQPMDGHKPVKMQSDGAGEERERFACFVQEGQKGQMKTC